MPKFKKKPIVIEAVQLRWDTWNEMCDHILGTNCKAGYAENGEDMELLIPTSEGTMTASHNDWVIKGIKGELYPCKPDIFEAIYEEV